MKFIRNLLAAPMLCLTLLAPVSAKQPTDAQAAPDWLVGTYTGHNANIKSTMSAQDRAKIQSTGADKSTVDEAMDEVARSTLDMTITPDGKVTAWVEGMSLVKVKGHYTVDNQISWRSGKKSDIIRTDKGVDFSEVGNPANVAVYTKVK